jgi:hypothetical protein
MPRYPRTFTRTQLGQVRPRTLLQVTQARTASSTLFSAPTGVSMCLSREEPSNSTLQVCGTRHSTGFATDGGKSRRVGAPQVPPQPSPELGMDGPLPPKWLVHHCTLAHQPLDVRSQAAPTVPVSNWTWPTSGQARVLTQLPKCTQL